VPLSNRRGRLALVASPQERADAVTIHADASIYAGLFDGDESAHLKLDPARRAYVHLIKGQLSVNGQVLDAGDAAMLQDEPDLWLNRGDGAEVLVFDLAA
jgi:redox-sensitive bicupin YhaK (pirin superfamily)